MQNNITVDVINPEAGAVESAESVSGADQPRHSEIITSAYRTWLTEMASWRSMITLTVDNDHWCSRDGMWRRFRTLLQILNRDLYGGHYTRMVGHSYFSYLLGFEYTKNDMVHAHFIVDKPINFSLLHKVWNHMSGFAYIKPAPDVHGAVGYVIKYVAKGQDLEIYKPKLFLPQPSFKPLWYSEHL